MLLGGCGKKETTSTASNSETVSRQSPPSSRTVTKVPGQTSANSPGFFLYVSRNEERTDAQDSVSEVPSLRKHRAILHCTDLVTNRPYEVNWRLIDPSGKDWQLSTPKFVTTPLTPNWSMWSTYNPPETPPKAGVWTWEVSLQDGPTYRREFSMTPPSQAEMAQLSRYENAREVVLRAFAQRWLGHEGYYFGIVGDGMSQLEGLSYRSRTDYVSVADLLNGITYKGKVSFTFRAFRLFGNDGRWGDWQDTAEHSSSFSEFLGEAFPGSLPARFQKGFDMNFTLQERDGHWRVWTDTGALYLNGRTLLKTFASPPSTSQVVQALNGRSSRTDSADQGESFRKSPPSSQADITKTMDQLRGRSLK